MIPKQDKNPVKRTEKTTRRAQKKEQFTSTKDESNSTVLTLSWIEIVKSRITLRNRIKSTSSQS